MWKTGVFVSFVGGVGGTWYVVSRFPSTGSRGDCPFPSVCA